MSFERKNLAYIVRPTENKQEELLHILNSVPGCAIVYTRNRKRTREIAELLVNNGITATFYHAGLNNDVKDQRQKSWLTGESRTMVATNAFGMGIDKPDVRIVIHIDMPDSPEAYFKKPDEQGATGRKHMLSCYTPKVIKPPSTNVSVIHFPTRIISEKCTKISTTISNGHGRRYGLHLCF